MYKIKSSDNQFEERSKSVFDSLSNIEACRKVSALTINASNEEIIDFNSQNNDVEELNPVGFGEKSLLKRLKTNDFQFKVPYSVPKQSIKNSIVSYGVQIKANTPDHLKNPEKWKKYSLEDVSDTQMSPGANRCAAMSFLKKQTNTVDNKQSSKIEHNEEAFRKLADVNINLDFNRPIGKNKFRQESALDEQTFEENDNQEIDDDKMEIESSNDKSKNLRLFIKKSTRKNLRKVVSFEENDELTMENKTEQLANNLAEKKDKDDDDDFKDYNIDNENNNNNEDFIEYEERNLF